MKNFLKYYAYINLLIVALTFTSCQEEFEDILNTEDQTTITANSSTAQLIMQTSSKDGSYDNIVDGSSCIAIQFPYTVKVRGLEISIDSIDDLKVIENIFDELDDDNDILDVIFPINVTLADFTEITINGIGELRELARECVEGGDDDIECIDFVYPLTFFTYDINKQQTGSVVIEGDRALRRFFHTLADDAIVSLNFPVQLELYDGTKITVNNHKELAEAIRGAKEACDEDDDNDYNDDDFDKERLDNYLAECPFLVREIKRNNQDQTAQYFEYVINFKENGEAKVFDRQGNILNGTWRTRVGAERVLLTLSFDTLVDFSLEWFVYEIEEGKIKLFSGDGNKIIMRRKCDFITNVPERLSTILKECKWEIAKAVVFNDPLDGLIGDHFKFKPNNVVSLIQGGIISNGTWEIKLNQQNVRVMAISIASQQDISLEWPIVDITNERIKFQIPSTNHELILEKSCVPNVVCSQAYIADVIQDCKWKITNEMGTFFQNLRIDFSNMNIHVHNPNNTVVDEGNWSVNGTVMTFNSLSMTLSNYIGEWNVIECGDNFFKMKRGEETIVLTRICE